MTTLPPDSDSQKVEPPNAKPPLEHTEARSGSAVRRIALVGGLVVAAVVVAVPLMDSDDPDPAATGDTGPEQGVACPFLREAFEAFEAGDDAAFVEAVRVAARESELTLERSGQVFGDPEDLALRIRAAVEDGGRSGLESLLAEGESLCTALGRWESPDPGND
jgi:hypothetical protein